MTRNVNRKFLKNAKLNKNDEFYTQLVDIEKELANYQHHFKNKVVFCNCDDARVSNFFNYFYFNSNKLKLKKLICAGYNHNNRPNEFQNGVWYEYSGAGNINNHVKSINYFRGGGDFRSSESIEFLNQADIVVTNPPFSLFREYIEQLIFYKKKFLVIGNVNCLTYKEVFNMIKENKAWLGINLGRGISGFTVPSHYDLYGTETRINDDGEKIISTNNCLWLTNLDNFKRHENIHLVRRYYSNESSYPLYDNFNAINVNKTKDIPFDYDGYMGVPITFLHKFNPEQFKIVRFRKGNDGKDLSVNGKCPYFRIIIKNKFISK